MGKGDKHKLAESIKGNKRKREIWENCDTLVIDEVGAIMCICVRARLYLTASSYYTYTG